MSKYIDAGKLQKSISNYMEGAHAALNPIDGNADYYKGKIDACKDIQMYIASLQQEQSEVDLEKFDKEVTKIWGRCAAEPNDSIACLHIETFNEVARHFYELGLNARKEE